MVMAMSFILLMCFSSFLGFALCGKDRELPRQSCGYVADRDENVDHFCVRRAPVVCSVHVVTSFRNLWVGCCSLHFPLEVRQAV